jgi:chromosome segregation ATPase
MRRTRAVVQTNRLLLVLLLACAVTAATLFLMWSQARDDIEDQEVKIEDLQVAVSDHEAAIERLTVEKTGYLSDIKSLNETIETKTTEYTELLTSTESFQQEKAALEAEKTELTAANSELERQNGELSKKFSDLSKPG